MLLDDIRALVFDMGGVLYDTPRETILMTRFIIEQLESNFSSEISDQQIVAAVNHADEIFDRRVVDLNLGPHWLPTFEDSIEYDQLILESLGVEGNLNLIASEAHRKWIEATPEMKPKFMEPCRGVFESLRSLDYRLGIASNRRNDPIPHLESDGILHFFDAIEYSCIPGYRKPSPYMLFQTSQKLGINPKKCAYVGDKVDPDMEAARRAEFTPILLVWCAPEEAEKASKDTLVLKRIEDLLEFAPGVNTEK